MGVAIVKDGHGMEDERARLEGGRGGEGGGGGEVGGAISIREASHPIPD